MHAEPICYTCEKPMERGFIFDQGYGHISQTRWVAGDPASPKFLGMKVGEVSSKQVGEGTRVWVYRCPDCGRLESYAIEITEEKD